MVGAADLCRSGNSGWTLQHSLSIQWEVIPRSVALLWGIGLGSFDQAMVEGIGRHFWFLGNQIMVLLWQPPLVSHTDKAITFVEASRGEGSNFKGEGEELGCEILYAGSEQSLRHTHRTPE